MFYSTPACYLKALNDANQTWPTKSDDFFPYASDEKSYWTGYFASRPMIKRYERVGNHFLQVSKQLSILTKNFASRADLNRNLDALKGIMGIMQHHDAVTGTEKQHVADDYALLLHRGVSLSEENTRVALNQLTNGQRRNPIEFSFSSCSELNISSCAVPESSESFMVTLYNPLGQSTDQYVRLPVQHGSYVVQDHLSVTLDTQLVPIALDVRTLHFRSSQATAELVFYASDIPPLGYRSYYVTRGRLAAKAVEAKEIFNGQKDEKEVAPTPLPESATIGNSHLNLTFDRNGLLSSVVVNGVQTQLTQNFYYYLGAAGNNRTPANRSSGAYIFRPQPNTKETRVASGARLRVVHGDLVDEVHQVSDLASILCPYIDCFLLLNFFSSNRHSTHGSAKWFVFTKKKTLPNSNGWLVAFPLRMAWAVK